jgi:hypothetical protein
VLVFAVHAQPVPVWSVVALLLPSVPTSIVVKFACAYAGSAAKDAKKQIAAKMTDAANVRRGHVVRIVAVETRCIAPVRDLSITFSIIVMFLLMISLSSKYREQKQGKVIVQRVNFEVSEYRKRENFVS